MEYVSPNYGKTALEQYKEEPVCSILSSDWYTDYPIIIFYLVIALLFSPLTGNSILQCHDHMFTNIYKTTRAVALTRSQPAPTTRIPLILHALACKMAPSSCLRTQQTAGGLRQMSANARASSAFAAAWLAVFIILFPGWTCTAGELYSLRIFSMWRFKISGRNRCCKGSSRM